MTALIADALAIDGVLWLVLAVCVAGLVRGFAGFGSAMIIMPVASSVLPPVQAVIFLIGAELIGPLPNLRAALRDGAPRDVAILGAGALLALPLGLWVLTRFEPVLFGWIVSVVVLALLILLMLGWRYSGALTRRTTLATGALGGFMTGFAGCRGRR